MPSPLSFDRTAAIANLGWCVCVCVHAGGEGQAAGGQGGDEGGRGEGAVGRGAEQAGHGDDAGRRGGRGDRGGAAQPGAPDP